MLLDLLPQDRSLAALQWLDMSCVCHWVTGVFCTAALQTSWRDHSLSPWRGPRAIPALHCTFMPCSIQPF